MIFSSLEFIFVFLPASLLLVRTARVVAGLGVVLGSLVATCIIFYRGPCHAGDLGVAALR